MRVLCMDLLNVSDVIVRFSDHLRGFFWKKIVYISHPNSIFFNIYKIMFTFGMIT